MAKIKANKRKKKVVAPEPDFIESSLDEMLAILQDVPNPSGDRRQEFMVRVAAHLLNEYRYGQMELALLKGLISRPPKENRKVPFLLDILCEMEQD